MTKLGIVSIVIDAARTRPQRPLKEFFQRPRVPIRSMYLYRLLVNMVWFARNYLNYVIVMVTIFSIWRPWFFICLVTSSLVHLHHQDEGKSRVFKLLSILGCAWNYYQYGVLVPALLALFVVGGLVTHALLMPYTDEASELFEKLTKVEACNDSAFEAPSTPVAEYEGTNQFGPHQLSQPVPRVVSPAQLENAGERPTTTPTLFPVERGIPRLPGQQSTPLKLRSQSGNGWINGVDEPSSMDRPSSLAREGGGSGSNGGDSPRLLARDVQTVLTPALGAGPPGQTIVGSGGKKRKTAFLVKEGEDVSALGYASSLPADFGGGLRRRPK
jgi:hypothetical protein